MQTSNFVPTKSKAVWLSLAHLVLTDPLRLLSNLSQLLANLGDRKEIKLYYFVFKKVVPTKFLLKSRNH